MKIFDDKTAIGQVLNSRAKRQDIAERHIRERHDLRIPADEDRACCTRDTLVAWVMGDDGNAVPPWERAAKP